MNNTLYITKILRNFAVRITKPLMSSNEFDDNIPMMQVGHIEINTQQFISEPNADDLPVLPTRNLVLFPGVTIPISLTRENSLKVAQLAADKHIPIGIVCQVDPEVEHPSTLRDLHRYGVVADVYQVIDLPDGSKTAIVHGRDRFRVMGKGAGATMPEAEISVRANIMSDTAPADMAEFNVTIENITIITEELSKKTSNNGDMSFVNVVKGIKDGVARLNFIATNIMSDPVAKVNLLSKGNLAKRALDLLAILMSDRERVNLAHDIMEKASQKMKENQRSAFLQMQLDTIKEELYGGGDEDDDYAELAKRASETKFPADVRATFDKELSKLRRLNPQSPDYSVQYSYLEALLELPWGILSKTTRDVKKAREVLENDHYGLEKVKQRILEQIAVIINNPKAKAPIICLVGPPGVGKTSLGKSIARAMGRNYQRVALGGLHDEAEIRGHRRTYIGAMPGRVLKAMKAAATSNPVLLLDEVDKLGKDYKGDPSSALLEVLDPEQNSTFHDNYVDVDFDLSNVLFIATANNAGAIEAPLLDRMEVINLSGYLLEEKIEIARRHLLPKVMKSNGLGDKAPFSIPDETLVALIENYTAESGVRKLESLLSSLVRKAILAKLSGEPLNSELRPEDLQPLLGLPLYNKDKYEGNESTGVVTGLAWTQVGGEILLAEAALSPGKGDRLTITGNLGDVMKESATIALQWVKSHYSKLNIAAEMFEQNNLHIHFPEGAIPKDGPSAGITVATAIASAFSGRKVRERIAMTGEITLRGKVLPVGGIKEKILAAKRAGIDTIVLCIDNKRDIEDIPENYRTGMNFHYVRTVDEVMDFALI